ncbi:MAG: Cna B-type domain-containing protein [Clostridiales bacterium]|nr:Cna B-type domain-containing protein [Clostridiales bacterium]MCI1961462.1 Cna B-type domain-containing protein [Clostridiales bacterium]MCI2022129.1 Cna B-type domain-containing protein [Clostridiales bacterium]MCI2025856.1 Cna B-type domain-containing protein [Clostridiales bacterium]MCI2160715.1 Cna B-type domain-containing protein [Oscillospiraceae bacterium]
MKKRIGKNMIALIVLLAVMIASVCPALASDSGGTIDLTKNGSISVTLLDNVNQKPISDAEFTLYRVADAYNSGYNLAYTFTNDFVNCGISLDNLSQEGLGTHLSAYADEHALSGETSKTTDASGLVTFSNLGTGLYLVRQTKATDGYYATNPFLVSVPMTINSEWVYDVDASPKAEAETESQKAQLTVNKVWVNNGVAVPDAVTVALLRDGITYKTVMLNKANNWSFTWQGLDTAYTWTAAELDVSDGYTVGYCTSGSIVTITNTSTVEIPETPTPEKPTSTLIQTGQLNWPIPVLAGLGILLVTVGWALFLAKKKNRHD